MTTEETSEDSPTPSSRKRRAHAGSNIWSYLPPGLGLALAGLVAGFAFMAWAVVLDEQATARSTVAKARADTYQSLLNARIGSSRQLVRSIAAAPAIVQALDPAAEDPSGALAPVRAALVPPAARIELFRAGTADVDLDAEVPINFAALDLINRAQKAVVGPEIALNQSEYAYMGAPVQGPDGNLGVVFAAFPSGYFTAPILALREPGFIAVEQQFETGAASTVIRHGAGKPGADRSGIERELSNPPWRLVYTPPPGPGTVAGLMPLALPFTVALLMTIVGFGLSFWRLGRHLTQDAGQLIELGSRLIRGRSAPVERYATRPFDDAARALAQQAADTSAKKPGRSAPKRTSEAPRRDRPPAPEQQKEETVDSDDFLEVSRAADEKQNFGIEVSEEPHTEPAASLDPQIFRAYDIRGVTTGTFNEDAVYWIGRAFAAEATALDQLRVAVGRDGRLSSPALRDALTRGLTEGGVDVIDVGEVPTPLLYYATHALDTGTGIQITGSHNPPEYNGLKMMLDGVTLAEERIQRLKSRIDNGDLSEGAGEVSSLDILDHYRSRVLEDVALAQPLKVVVDCGNGVAGVIAPQLLEDLGCEVIPLYCEVDGNFPNHHPDPADPHTLEDLITVVLAEKADLGLAFDGDGDRLGLITDQGNIIWPDKMMMLFAKDIVGRNPGADIIYDVKCSRHLNTIISELGGRPIMWKTGHSHIKAHIKETGALLGGEFSGHICFAERWYGFDDAIYTAARLLEIVSAENQSVESLFAQFPVTFTTPEIKVVTTEDEKFEIMAKLAQEADFGDAAITTIDGLRVDYPTGWGLIRPSNTSPVLTLRFEADDQASLDRIQNVFREQLAKVDPKLSF